MATQIAVVGTGYVGLSNAVVLAQHNHVTAIDINAERVDKIKRGVSPIVDRELEDYLARVPLSLTATTDGPSAYRNADIVVIATPTDYDPATNFFDTSTVEAVAAEILSVNPRATIVIKSTLPVGFTAKLRDKHPGAAISIWAASPRTWRSRVLCNARSSEPSMIGSGNQSTTPRKARLQSGLPRGMLLLRPERPRTKLGTRPPSDVI